MNKSKIVEWKEMERQLKELKQKEMELRKKIAFHVLGDTQFNKGRATNKADIDGIEIKATLPLNYTINEEILSQIWNSLPNEEKECIIYKPRLSLRIYHKLPKDSLINEALSTKFGAPTLSIL